ncbi:MAG TPA: AAA family ATPase [Candidatus Saccharimonadales bacterium]|nr:AAA family ATPase [Candidatus Saccharimonadales bacterium]
MTKLIILRGNSGSGKSSVAHELRMRMGYGTAVVEQDYIRRELLREQDKPGQPNIELIRLNAQFALGNKYDVIIEGILPEVNYGSMLRNLISVHEGDSYVYYFDIPFEETVRRHATRDKSKEFNEAFMRELYLPQDFLGTKNEQVIAEDSAFEATVERILRDISS